MNPNHKEFFVALRGLCEKHGVCIMAVNDELQFRSDKWGRSYRESTGFFSKKTKKVLTEDYAVKF